VTTMKRRILTTAFILTTVCTPSLVAQVISNDFVQKGSATASPQDQLYKEGQEAMDNGRWSDAAAKFDAAAKTNGARSDAALYWKAYSLNKTGRAQEALETISALLKKAPNSRYAQDARALEAQIRPGSVVQNTGDPGRPGRNEDEEMKLVALNALMNRDEDRAIPLLERFLASNQSKRLREKALFVLGQSDNPKAVDMISRIARGELYPELQTKAIHQIGVVNANDRNMNTLSQIYATSTSYDVKRTILQTFGINGSKELLMKAVRSEKDEKLQRAAIQGLGIAGAKTELRTLYKELPGYEAKRAVLDAFIVSGDDEAFAEVARTETNPQLLRKAIQGIGISGGRGSGAALVAIYQQRNEPEVKRAALEGLFVSDNAKALVDLAKAERDPEMRRRIVEKLSVMDNKEATDYMIEILNK
jgi:HEAT repeat protein